MDLNYMYIEYILIYILIYYIKDLNFLLIGQFFIILILIYHWPKIFNNLYINYIIIYKSLNKKFICYLVTKR